MKNDENPKKYDWNVINFHKSIQSQIKYRI